ncbi:MAG: hypothetical protein CM15mP89_0800 [Gammaproteobacteria bacterium]|nr:MAG: hypothetical protein CM15mP89_0800 [Gammaproteobacteria bacterium]
MKQELTTFIWPALVGVLAAALILDKWVLEPQETGNAQVNSGYRDAVALATPSVVNIYTAKLVDARTDPRLNSPLQRRLFSNRGSRPAHRALAGLWRDSQCRGTYCDKQPRDCRR